MRYAVRCGGAKMARWFPFTRQGRRLALKVARAASKSGARCVVETPQGSGRRWFICESGHCKAEG
jgi:hypothetical protein